MGSLSNEASKRFARINQRPKLPEWWGLASGAMVAILLAVVALGMMTSGGHAATRSYSLPAPGAQSAVTVGGAYSPPGTGTPVTTAAPARSETLPATSGHGSLAVPVAAADAATAAALATYTTDFSTVPLAPGSTPPSLPHAWPNARITRTTVSTVTAGAATFDFIVAPDGVTADGLRSLAVQVVADNGQWVYPVAAAGGSGAGGS